MKIFIASDHAGFVLKGLIKEYFKKTKMDAEDMGPLSEKRCDYPDYAFQLAKQVAATKGTGILVCGSGIGMSIVANKVKGIRAALCSDEYHAEMARAHNDANVLCLSARTTNPKYAEKIISKFLSTPFEGGRHTDRIEKIRKIEEGSLK